MEVRRSEPPRSGVIVVVLPGEGREQTRTGIARTASHNRTPLVVSASCEPMWLAAAGLTDVAPDVLSPAYPAGTDHPRSDVVLLLSGAEVHGDWLDRVRAAAYSEDDAATATPFGNVGRFARYPAADQTPGCRLDGSALDRAAREWNAGKRLPLPSPGGSCVYLRRDYLEGFREGRATGSRRHLLAADVYVGRHGGDGTGDPGATISTSDAVGILRRNLDLSRLCGPGPAMLFVTHAWGGGTERYVRGLAANLEAEGVRVVILRSEGRDELRLERPAAGATPDLHYRTAGEYYALRAALGRLGIFHIHIHHLIGHGPTTRELIAGLGVPYDVTLTDQYFACPRAHMADENGRYCGEPAPDKCDACLARRGDVFRWHGDADIRRWRQDSAALLEGARHVFLLHPEMRERMRRYFPRVPFAVRRPAEDTRGARVVAATLRENSPLRVALLGLMCAHKGLPVLRACATDASLRTLPIEFRVVGYCEQAAELEALGNVRVTGPYREEEVFDVLAAQECHCALFLSTVPETHSYTLSAAFAGGLYTFGLDIGAQGARIREHGQGEVIPFDTAASAINDRLLAARERLTGGLPAKRPDLTRYDSLLADYYGLTPLPGSAPGLRSEDSASPGALLQVALRAPEPGGRPE